MLSKLHGDEILGCTLLDRLTELIDEREALEADIAEAREGIAEEGPDTRTTDAVQRAVEALEDWDDSDESDELAALQRIENEISRDDYLVADDHFEDYARRLAEELELIPSEARWPATCIDWDQAASELQHDYHTVEFDEVTYWVRS